MRVPLSWLREYVDFKESPESLAEILTCAGLEVTKTDRLGVDGAELEWPRDKVVLARLLRVERHPEADRLVLATVEYGADEPKTVVTGAPNLYPYLDKGDLIENLFGALLLEGGTYLDPYKDGKPARLKGKKLRGIYNDAMLCSGAELGLGEDHDGIILIEDDPILEGHEPGTPLQDVLGDVIFDIDIIPNVARCASMVGVAREVVALTGGTLRLPDCDIVPRGAPLHERVRISTESPELNPRFVAVLIEGVEQKAAPFWMQHRLRLAGQRPIGIVVDVSNYVMLELGQPNHSFDFDFLRRRAAEYGNGDRTVHLVTRLARKGECLTTLDGEERSLLPNNMLVTDPLGPLSLAGIMGGAESEIRPETNNVLLEAAAWNFINIRQSSRQHTLLTDAAFRFSRGVHPSQALLGAKRAAKLLSSLAGGTLVDGIVDYYPHPPPTITVDLHPEYVRNLSGLEIDGRDMATLLERLEFEVTSKSGETTNGEEVLQVTTPDHRLDIEGPHDLVEEICRVYGYDRVPSTILADALPPQRGNPELEIEEHLKDLLVGLGLQEVVTYRLTTPEAESRALVAPAAPDSYVRLVNPVSVDRVVLRHSLLASVLEVAARNSRFVSASRLFEIGLVYPRDSGEALPSPAAELVIVMTGPRATRHWQDDEPKVLDFFDLKGVLDGLSAGLKMDWSYQSSEHVSLRPGITAQLVAAEPANGNEVEIGFIGEIHPRIPSNYELRLEPNQGLYAAILDLDVLLPLIPARTTIDEIPTYPAIHEDLALVVDSSITAAEIEAILDRAGGHFLASYDLFDFYEDDQLGTGKKSLAYHLVFQSPTKTLRDKDASRARNRILAELKKEVGAHLRE